MSLFKRTFAAIVIGLTAAQCSGIQAHGEFVPAAPYHDLATFSFAPNEGPPGGYHLSARSLVVAQQMEPLVAAELTRRGYVQAPDGQGDIVVACGAGRREAARQIRLNWRITSITGEEFEDQDFVEGGIVIDAFDKSGGQIWHGAARTPIDPAKPSDARLREAVAAALSRFPSHAGKR